MPDPFEVKKSGLRGFYRLTDRYFSSGWDLQSFLRGWAYRSHRHNGGLRPAITAP